jgi:carbon-monoxide dehydrogenase medium subunit
MYDFAYHRPGSLADAARLAKSEDAKLVAGGMTLIPTMKQRLARPSDLIDIGGLKDLVGIKVDGGKVTIGALTPHGQVAASADVKRAIPALAALAGGIGDPQVRNCGTIGGSLANNDPAADYPAAALGLGATIQTNERAIAADDYFKGMFETALKPAEIITAVSFPTAERAGYAKFRNPASRYAIIGVFVAKTAQGVRVAVTGAGNGVFRVKAMEDALARSWSADALKGVSIPASQCNGDIHASSEYRAHLIGVMAQRALA